MKTFNIYTAFYVSVGIVFAASAGAELDSIPEFTLTEQDRNSLVEIHIAFRAEMASAQTVQVRQTAIDSLWANNTIAQPTEPQTDAGRQVAIASTAAALLGEGRPVYLAVRDGMAVEFANMEERRAVFAKSVAYMALITDSAKLGSRIPSLLESRSNRVSFSRDDHFTTLVIRELSPQCIAVDSLEVSELAVWTSLANAQNAACRLVSVISIGSVTRSATDRLAVFSETADEGETSVLAVIIEESSVLSPIDRGLFLHTLLDNNNALTVAQVTLINSILNPSS